MQSSASTIGSVAFDPFAPTNLGRVGRSFVVQRPFERTLEDGTVEKGLADWVIGQQFGSILGGSESLRDPLVENVWLAAAAKVLRCAVRSVELHIYSSDEPEDDNEVTAESDPVLRLLKRPNSLQVMQEIMGRSVLHRIDKGEDWWFLVDAAGKPVALNDANEFKLPASIVQASGRCVQIGEQDDYGFPKSWRFTTATGAQLVFPEGAALRFIDDRRDDIFRGLGVVETLMRELSAYFQAQRYVEGLSRNSGEMAGILLFKNASAAEQLKARQTQLNDFVSNPDNRGKYQVFGGDEAQFIPNQLAPKDMEFEALFAWVRDAICSAVGVPLLMLGVHGAGTYENASQARRAFWQDTVIPYLRSIEFVLNNKFFPRIADARFKNYRAFFDLDDIEALREDTSDNIVKASQVAVQQNLPLNSVLPAMGVEAKIDGADEVAPDSFGISMADPASTQNDGGTTPNNAPTSLDAAPSQLVGQDVAAQVLNGAQIAQAVAIVAQVTAGELPRDSGIAMLVQFFGLMPAEAESVMGSAGTNAPTTPNPNPAATAATETPQANANSDGTQVPAEGAKSLTVQTRAAGPITERAARVEYWDALEKALGQPSEAVVLRASKKYLKRYFDAQVSRIESFVRNGRSLKTKAGRAFNADWERREIAPDATLEAQLRILELNREEWDRKLAELFATPLEQVSATSLRMAAAELSTVSIGVGHPAMVQALSEQTIKLAADLNGTLAEQVRTSLMDALSGTTSIGDLQSRLREILPDIDSTVSGAIGDRDARALRIARTESGKASTTARFEQFKADAVTEVQWITQGDAEVRDSHEAVDGQVIPMGGRFTNGLRYPLDPEGSASETINCRCQLKPVVNQ